MNFSRRRGSYGFRTPAAGIDRAPPGRRRRRLPLLSSGGSQPGGARRKPFAPACSLPSSRRGVFFSATRRKARRLIRARHPGPPSAPGGRSASWRRTPSHAPRLRTRRDPRVPRPRRRPRRPRASLSALVSTARTGRSAARHQSSRAVSSSVRGVADVHQHHHPGQRLPRFQVPSDEGAPLPAHRAGHLGVAVPRQVHEPAPLVEREEVDQPGAAGGPAGPGEAAPAGERVDGARLPCVRPPRERHLAAAVGRKVADGGDADEEPGLAVVDRRCRRSARIRERVDPVFVRCHIIRLVSQPAFHVSPAANRFMESSGGTGLEATSDHGPAVLGGLVQRTRRRPGRG